MPQSYVSGNPLSDTSTYLNQTFSSLQVTPGTYVWTWGTGEDQNFTLIIGAAAIPEPASLKLLGGGTRRAAAGGHHPPPPTKGVKRIEKCQLRLSGRGFALSAR